MELLLFIPLGIVVVYGAALLAAFWELFWKAGFLLIGAALVVETVKTVL